MSTARAVKVGRWEDDLELHGIKEGFLEEVLFELGLGVRRIWTPLRDQGPLPEQRKEVEDCQLRALGGQKRSWSLYLSSSLHPYDAFS